jgi:hypothetical protein
MILPMTQKTNLSAADLIKPNPAPVAGNQKTEHHKPNNTERKEKQMSTSTITNQPGGFRLFNPLSGILIGGLLLGLTGCATTRQQSKGTPEVSGFLGDYSQLHEGTNGQAKLVYWAPDVDWAKYTKVWIKPIELWKADDPDSPMNKISPENQQHLIDLLNTALYNALSTNFMIVDSGGPDVLIVHAAITDAKKSKPVIGAISAIYLPLKLISFGKQELAGTGIGVGSVTIEAELLDGQTNQRLAAAVDSRSGSMAIRSKFSGTWGDVDKSFEWWAARLDQRLIEEKAGSATKTDL